MYFHFIIVFEKSELKIGQLYPNSTTSERLGGHRCFISVSLQQGLQKLSTSLFLEKKSQILCILIITCLLSIALCYHSLCFSCQRRVIFQSGMTHFQMTSSRSAVINVCSKTKQQKFAFSMLC